MLGAVFPEELDAKAGDDIKDVKLISRTTKTPVIIEFFCWSRKEKSRNII